LYLFPEFLAEDAIAILQQVAWELVSGESVPQLLAGPLRRRVLGQVEVDPPATIMSQLRPNAGLLSMPSLCAAVPLPPAFRHEPRRRGDGREIYYLSEDRKLMAVAVGAGPPFGVPKTLFQTRVPEGSLNRSKRKCCGLGMLVTLPTMPQ